MRQELFGRERVDMARNLARVGCPWGEIQDITRYGGADLALAVYSVSTPGHGGFYVGAGLYGTMPDCLKACAFPGGAGGQWFEEDCSWCAVALAFPELFTPLELGFAIRTCRGWYPEAWSAYAQLGEALSSGPAHQVLSIEAEAVALAEARIAERQAPARVDLAAEG